ncbi:hypothetical protein HDU98_010861 [Podochytrium sp. JEL0797]|nr:hypothetical protein HDU98_010861 [Podochytrium sp. JEL0797]
MKKTWASIASQQPSPTGDSSNAPLRPNFTPLDSTRRTNPNPLPNTSNPPEPPTTSAPLPTRIESLAATFPNLRLEHISESNLPHLAELNDQSFPIKYERWFYDRILENPQLTVLCYEPSAPTTCIGAILGRKQLTTATGAYDVYISTVAVLPSHQHKGLASGLLETLVSKCRNDRDPQRRDFVLHVHVLNEAARRLYLRQGFKVEGKMEGYYSLNHLVEEPRDAYFLRLKEL